MVKIFERLKDGSRRQIKVFGKTLISYTKSKDKKYDFKKCGEGVIVANTCRIYVSNNITIGNNVRIGDNNLISGLGGITIGNNVVTGPDVTIWTANHNYEEATKLPYDEDVILRPVTIEDNVWIGAKAIIVPGITIKEGAVVAMGAVVTKNVPKGAIVGGNPAKVLKYRNMEKYEKLKQEKSFYFFKH